MNNIYKNITENFYFKHYYLDSKQKLSLLDFYRKQYGVSGSFKSFSSQLIYDFKASIDYPVTSLLDVIEGGVSVLGATALLLSSPLQIFSKNNFDSVSKQAEASSFIAEQGAEKLIFGIGGLLSTLILWPAMLMKTVVNFVTASVFTVKDIFVDFEVNDITFTQNHDFYKNIAVGKEKSFDNCELSNSKFIYTDESGKKVEKEFSELMPDTYITKAINLAYQPFGYANRGLRQAYYGFGGLLENGVSFLKGIADIFLSPINALLAWGKLTNNATYGVDGIKNSVYNAVAHNVADRFMNVFDGNKKSFTQRMLDKEGNKNKDAYFKKELNKELNKER
jgi:hypothetical protein